MRGEHDYIQAGEQTIPTSVALDGCGQQPCPGVMLRAVQGGDQLVGLLLVRRKKEMEMGQRLGRFFAGSPKPLRLAFVGWVIAAIGVALAFSIDFGPGKPLAYVAAVIVLLGIGICWVGVGWGCWRTFFRPSGDRGDGD